MTRRFHFSLRALLVAVTLVAAACAWIGSTARLVRQRRDIVQGERVAASIALGGPFTNRWPAVLVAVFGWGFVGASVGSLWRDARMGALAAIYATPVVVLVVMAVGVTFVLLW